ncbi:hemerythrin domain-containing protein [Altererythrobacter soli]|uniref:Hemerythrin domain-containing protein n=1 Tax=Croceibacterium soli TaxID=1739690 RepID=A0A6I4URP4_9SPHN|nr:hemerythrin domain-containing protein [Croceibacterium soli]MXP41650.1 hemerythrin domain-containing protein [Croceibacterium soli]
MSRSAKAPPKGSSSAKKAAAKPNKSSKEGKVAPRADPAADAIAILEADHREVERLFDKFEAAEGDANKRDLANAICVALKVHARLEEELFYPAAYAVLGDKSLIEEAQVEHASAKDLIAQIETGAPGEAFYDARVKVLAEYVDHHVTEEEEEIFPQCRRSKMDLDALGAIMALRKQELMAGFLVSNPILALS